MKNNKIITIDGGSGTGKTTVSKNIAKQINYHFLSTGKIFRCMAYLFKEQNKALFEKYSTEEILKNKDIEKLFYNLVSNFSFDQNNDEYLVSNLKITDADLNSEFIANLASKISAYQIIRACYEEIVQEQIANHRNGIILEGRDCGTVIAPFANNKFFLTCSVEKQISNRLKDYGSKNIDIEKLRNQIIQRDKENKERVLSPLIPAKDAFVIDCSDLNLDQIVAKILSKIENKKRSH